MKAIDTLTPVDKVLCLQNVDVFKHATTEMLACIGSIAAEVELAAPAERNGRTGSPTRHNRPTRIASPIGRPSHPGGCP